MKNGMKRKAGGARKSLAIVLYVGAAFGALLCLLDLASIGESLRRNASTGDFAGASLGTMFLLTMFLPSTLIAVLVALWLHPPGWMARPEGTAAVPAEGAALRGRDGRGLLTLGLGVAGVDVLAAVGIMLVNALQGGYRDYGLRGPALVQLAIQDLIWFSPLLVFSGLLFWFAARVANPRRDH